jgi:hypothetical protein
MVDFANFNTPGAHNWILADLRAARSALGPLLRGRSGPLLIQSVTTSGHFLGDAGDTLGRMKDRLRESERLYRQGNSLVFLAGGDRPRLGSLPAAIAVDGAITKTASAIVGNVVMCQERKANSGGKGARLDQPLEYELQFPVPQSVLQQLVVSDGFMDDLPEARYVFSHPVFDEDFQWLGPGYHASQKILVCGEDFEPAELGECMTLLEPPGTTDDVLLRLPPLTRRWVQGFHWNSTVDLVNYLGLALMIPLMPILVRDGHPGGMFWGNKPGIGKSVAAQGLAVLKDGVQASPTTVDGNSREIENQIASELNDGRTVIFLDNLKGSLNAPVIEANMTAKEVGVRLFHLQKKLRRANDLLWLTTTNDATPSEDMLSRCVHVRLHYEGVPDTHRFVMTEHELMGFLQANRTGILAELAGMVTRWLDAGRPMAPAASRFAVFGQVIGSVLAANGLTGFLTNTVTEVREHSSKHQQLIAVAGRVLDGMHQGFVWVCECPLENADEEFKRRPPPGSPKEQKDWVHLLQGEGVISATADTAQKRATAATQFLRGVVKVPVEVDVGEETIRGMIVSRPLGGRRMAYALAVDRLPGGGSGADGAAAGAVEHGADLIAAEVAAPTAVTGVASELADDGADGGGLWD